MFARLLVEWHVGRGLSKLRKGEHEAALRHIERALLLCDDVRLHIYRAMALARMGKGELAQHLLLHCEARCREHSGANASTLVLLARAYDELGIKGKALNLCRDAIKADSRNFVAGSMLAMLLLESGETDEALWLLKTCEVADDPIIQARLLLALEGIASRLQPKDEEMLQATEELNQTIQGQTQPVPILSAILSWWFGWKGMRAVARLKLHEAIKWFAIALSHNPGDINLRVTLGLLLLDFGAIEPAEQLAQGIQETHSDYHLLKGAIHLQRGELDAAMRELELADKLLALTHYFLGLCALLKGEPESAMAMFKRAFEIDPAFVRTRIFELVKLLSEGFPKA